MKKKSNIIMHYTDSGPKACCFSFIPVCYFIYCLQVCISLYVATCITIKLLHIMMLYYLELHFWRENIEDLSIYFDLLHCLKQIVVIFLLFISTFLHVAYINNSIHYNMWFEIMSFKMCVCIFHFLNFLGKCE